MTTKTYARIADGAVAELVTLDAAIPIAAAFHSSLTFVDVTGISPAPQQGWTYSAPNTFAAPVPVPPTAAQVFAAAVAAGIQIASTGTPALNGTYAITADAKGTIDGVYSGIKDGDGLPGGGATFNYSDITEAAHTFSATTFPPFAKAVRDYLYALSQGQAPTLPVTIP